MRVEVVRKFYDLEKKVDREVGEKFAVTKERFEQLNSTKYGELVRDLAKAEKE